jgi:hypothetical protein
MKAIKTGKYGQANPAARYPNCEKKLDGFTGVGHEHTPSPGDFTLCAYCKRLACYRDDLTLRRATQADFALLDADARESLRAAGAFVDIMQAAETPASPDMARRYEAQIDLLARAARAWCRQHPFADVRFMDLRDKSVIGVAVQALDWWALNEQTRDLVRALELASGNDGVTINMVLLALERAQRPEGGRA